MKTEKQVEKEIVESNWNVKAVKFMPGHDADSMSCNLYFNNKKVATVWDDSWGGGFQYTWSMDMEAEFRTFAKSFTVPNKLFPDGMTYNMDMVVDVLVTRYLAVRDVKKLLKKIAYRKGDGIYTCQAYFKPTPENFNLVKAAKWWDDSCIILNKLPLEEVIKHYDECAR